MVKVLIAHDRVEVLRQIRDVVKAQGIPEHLIEEAEDGQTVRQKLASEMFDLVVLDLTMPAVKGKSKAEYSTAEDIFVELFKGDTMNIPGDIIGITREDEALQRIDTTIGSHLMAVVAETSGDEWKSRLADRIAYTMKSASARLLAASRRYDYDAAIITALDEEFEPFTDLFEMAEASHFAGGHEFLFRDHENKMRRGIIFSVGGAGQAACASFAQAIIARFRPKLFILSGFCGGYEKKTSAGEILLFRTVYDWDSGKWETVEGKPPAFQPRSVPISIPFGEADRVIRSFGSAAPKDSAMMSQKVKALSAGEVTDIIITPVLAASGSAVIANIDILHKIRSPHDKIVAVDMECYGFYKACISTPSAQPQMLCIKTVADFCDGEKHDRLHASSCYSSAIVAEEILLYRWRF